MGPNDERAIWNDNAPAWIEMSRAGHDVYRDVVNSPAFFSMLPDVTGLRCLDVGCGEGHNTRLLAERGADVVGVDVSDRFIRAAATADTGHRIVWVHANAAALPFPTASFDAATAVMSLMDTADPERVLHEIARVVRPGGFVQFSVSHPVIATRAHRWLVDADGHREALAVGGYFDEGAQVQEWTFGTAPEEMRTRHRPFRIIHERRTVAGWINAVVRAGLTIDEVGEPRATRDEAARLPSVADTRLVPYFLHIRGVVG